MILKKTYLFLLLIMLNETVYAGNQQYESLKNDTKQLMSQSVADNPPDISSFKNKQEEREWINKVSKRLVKFSRTNLNEEQTVLLLKSIHYEAIRAGIDPELLLSIIEVESGFKKYSISSVGARGYTQVMPFWINLIGSPQDNLFNMRTNLRYGAVILKHYIDIEKGNLFRALGRYNGSLGKAEYPNAVLGALRKWQV